MGINLAVKDIFDRMARSYWLKRYGNFKCYQSSQPIKDLEPMLATRTFPLHYVDFAIFVGSTVHRLCDRT